ncbi:MAG: hypothetical protein AAB932_03650 [Patescibacteria group bacterium]
MLIFLHKLVKQPLLWAFLIMLLSEYGAYRFFGTVEQIPVLAAVSTGLVVMFGYFATHYLTIARKQNEEKFNKCLELIKRIRFFILELDYKGKPEHSKMRDELQDAYFAFSLLTSEKSYKALSEMMDAFKALLTDPTQLYKFKKAQSKFINSLRKEFFIDKEIDFETYDFKLNP